LIHWESQVNTKSNSNNGLRYQNQMKEGFYTMLLARINTNERDFYFLRRATYLKHELETPMAITWQLNPPLPGNLYANFATAVT
jgi:hypothetical protein